jgi:hypothetical protein
VGRADRCAGERKLRAICQFLPAGDTPPGPFDVPPGTLPDAACWSRYGTGLSSIIVFVMSNASKSDALLQTRVDRVNPPWQPTPGYGDRAVLGYMGPGMTDVVATILFQRGGRGASRSRRGRRE